MANPLYRLYPITASMSAPTPPTPTGVLSLNTLTGIVSLVAGTNITITPAGSTITIDATAGSISLGTANGLSLVGSVLSLGLSSAGSNGALSSTDWSTFNSKQAAGSYITALTGDGAASGPGSAALTLATVNSNVGSFGSASAVTALTVNAKGLITAAASTSIQIAESQVTSLVSDLAAKALKTTTISTTAPLAGGGDLSTSRTLSIPAAATLVDGYLTSTDWNTFNNKQPAGNYITALTGDAVASGPGSAALTLATVNSNVGSFGTATQVGTITVNAKGLVTAASNTAILISESQVTSLVSDLLAKADKTTIISTTSPLAGGGDLSTNRTLSIPVATALADGYLSAADWTTFNNKQAALTPGTISTSTTGVTVGSGTSSTVGPNVTVNIQTASTSQPGLISSTDWNTFNNKQSTLTLGNLTAAGTDGIAVTSGSGAVIGAGTSIAQHVADASHNGYLSSTDWSTFNGKGAGSVTSVAMTVPTFLSIAGSPVTTSGTLAVTLSGTALPLLNGGTGQTTKAPAFDALSPMSAGGDLIYGGTAGTGTRLPNGTTGQVLVSGGGTAAPVWTSTEFASVTGPSTLRTFSVMNEDWITGALAGSYGWTSTLASGTIAVNTANIDGTHWGVIALTSGTTSGNAALLSTGVTARMAPSASSNMYVEMYINLSRLATASTDDYIFRCGLMDNWTGLPNNGIWFDYNRTGNGANWFRSTANGGSRSQVDSGAAVATGWLKLAFKVTGATSAEFFVNDVSIGTNSGASMPTATGMYSGIGITKGANGSTNTTALIDYYSMYAQWPGGR